MIQGDAGYYDLIRIDSSDPGSASDASEIQLLKSSGTALYLELLEDGTGTFCMGGAMAVTWGDGFVEAEGQPVPYTVEGNELYMGTEELMFVFSRVSP